MPTDYTPHREILIVPDDMDEIADRIVARDIKHHTGGSAMVIRVQAVNGELRHPFKRRGEQ